MTTLKTPMNRLLLERLATLLLLKALPESMLTRSEHPDWESRLLFRRKNRRKHGFSSCGRQVLWDICRKALDHNVLQLKGTGNESRDFVHAGDISRALFLVAERGSCRGEVYNLASGIETTVLELARLILKSLCRSIPIEFDGRVPEGTPLNWRADISLLGRLGFVPQLPVEKGIESYVQWARSEPAG